jgi:hypothetical protein
MLVAEFNAVEAQSTQGGEQGFGGWEVEFVLGTVNLESGFHGNSWNATCAKRRLMRTQATFMQILVTAQQCALRPVAGG